MKIEDKGKLTISQALNEDNEKVRSLAAVKELEKKQKRSLTSTDFKDSLEKKEKEKERNHNSRFYRSK